MYDWSRLPVGVTRRSILGVIDTYLGMGLLEALDLPAGIPGGGALLAERVSARAAG